MLATLLLSSALAATEPAAWHRYDVVVDDALRTLEVRACFADGLPNRLLANDRLSEDATIAFRYQRDGRKVTAKPRSNAVILPVPSDDGCIEWTTDLERIAAANRVNVGYRAGESLVLAPGTWFWHPPVLAGNRDIEFRFHLPAGTQISVPWRALESENDTRRFRYGRGPLHWSGLMAIGDLAMRDFAVPGATLHLAITDGPAKTDMDTVLGWLQPAALAVTELWGTFPVEEVQLLVIPLPDGSDAAPWAQTNRGGGAGAHFYMNAGAPAKMLREDWIATHEFAHFALPFIERDDAWLSEGFASYYQNVLRARAGILSPHAAWQALHEGFMRGNRDTEYDTLRDDTRHMQSRGRVMRVYWSGAAMALLADVELRRRSDGAWSLDRVLQEFNRCCRFPERTWTGRALFERFDAISGMDVFATLYAANVHSRHFPRLTETLDSLGVETDGKNVRLDDTAPLAGVRIKIMAPPQTDAAATLKH